MQSLRESQFSKCGIIRDATDNSLHIFTIHEADSSEYDSLIAQNKKDSETAQKIFAKAINIIRGGKREPILVQNPFKKNTAFHNVQFH